MYSACKIIMISPKKNYYYIKGSLRTKFYSLLLIHDDSWQSIIRSWSLWELFAEISSYRGHIYESSQLQNFSYIECSYSSFKIQFKCPHLCDIFVNTPLSQCPQFCPYLSYTRCVIVIYLHVQFSCKFMSTWRRETQRLCFVPLCIPNICTTWHVCSSCEQLLGFCWCL